MTVESVVDVRRTLQRHQFQFARNETIVELMDASIQLKFTCSTIGSGLETT